MTTKSPPSPSPSPPPEAPIPLQPGPRASKLQELYTKALKATIASIRFSSFEACFPTLAVTAPVVLKSLHADLLKKLELYANNDFNGLVVERKVVERLNELERVIEEAKRRKESGGEGQGVVVAPHTLPPQDLMRAHLAPLHAQQQSQLNARIQTTASTNARLAQEIAQQREEIERLVTLVETLVKDIDGANEGMEGLEDGNGVEGLSLRAREAEEVLVANGT